MNQFERNIRAVHGQKGSDWLANLPHLVKELALKWGLTDLVAVENLSYHYVLSGFRGAQPIILKLGPDIQVLEKEAEGLQALKSPVTIQLLAYQPGALLLERAVPGVSLEPFFPERDQEALVIACTPMQQLHKLPLPAGHTFPTLERRLSTLDKDCAVPEPYLHKARRLKKELMESTTRHVLLHGDFHHQNILQHKERWVIIDPRCVIGDPTYELATFICNPVQKLIVSADAHKIITDRIATAARILDVDPQRIAEWTFVHATLAWAWSLEDGGIGADDFKWITEIVGSLLF